MINAIRKKEKGMFTVEAVFVIPIMLLSIFAIIYLSVVHYQNIVAVAEATRSANRVASYWSYIGTSNPPALIDGTEAENIITQDSYTDRSPYRFIIETGSAIDGSFGGLSKRRDNGQHYASERVAGLKFDTYSTGAVNAKLKTEVGFLSSYVVVSVNKGYKNPLGSLLEVLGLGDTTSYESQAKSLITSPSEFIRNVDMIFQVGNYLYSWVKGS